jgi:hypothetical protein
MNIYMNMNCGTYNFSFVVHFVVIYQTRLRFCFELLLLLLLLSSSANAEKSTGLTDQTLLIH